MVIDCPCVRAYFGIFLHFVAVLATTVLYDATIDCQSGVNRAPAGLDNAQVRKHSVPHLLAGQVTGRR